MSSVIIAGDTSGTVTLQAPSAAGSTVINLPTVSGGSFVVSDASGNVGIGTSSPSYKLDVSYNSFDVARFVTTASNTDARVNIEGLGTGLGALNSVRNGLVFQVGGSERARIDTSGNLLVGTASLPTGSTTSVALAPVGFGIPIVSSRGLTAAAEHIRFYNPNGLVGSIQTSGTATSYVTSSDYRLKENIAPMTGALSVIQQLKPCTYNWKVDGSDGQGFIAHELAEVVPDCVTGEKDAVDTDGNPVYQGIDTSFLVATLTAAIQELKAELDEVKAQLKGAA